MPSSRAGSSMPRSSSRSVNVGRSPVGMSVPRCRPSRGQPGRVVERVEVGEADDVALAADDLGDLGDPAGAVAQPAEVHDQVERRSRLVADRPERQLDAGHERHGLDAGQRVPGRVGVQGRQRAVVARVHRLEHVDAPRRRGPRRR